MQPVKIKSIKKIGVRNTYDLSTPIYHNYILNNGVVSHNSFKSGMLIEIGRFMYDKFGGKDITFTDTEFLARVKVAKKSEFVLRDEITKEYGIGSGRQNAFIVMQTETLRAHRTSLGFISPTLKQIDTAHYILHVIGHNNFEIGDDGDALEPVYVLAGVINPMTRNYLGGLIVEIEWLNKVWKQYWKKKVEFLKSVQDRHFAKADFFKLVDNVLELPESAYAKTKYEWFVLIQKAHPDLTTEEIKMVYATIKLRQRMG